MIKYYFFILPWIVITAGNIVYAAEPGEYFNVRVLLDQQKDDTAKTWSVRSAKGLRIKHIQDGEIKRVQRGSKLEIKADNRTITINNQTCTADNFEISPLDGHLCFEGKDYQGSLLLMRDNQRVCAINKVDIEDYITSVIRTESWPGWPLEVNKVLAVACRSYVASKVLESRKAKKPYHIKNTNIHQTYSGVHGFTELKRAVQETKSLILAYDRKPICAMFDACCGGLPPARMANLDWRNFPYLKRKTCTFCKSCKLYSWQVEYQLETFKALLAQHDIFVGAIKDVRVTKKDAAGIVQEVTLKGSKGVQIFSGKKMYALFKKIKSFSFSVVKRGNKIMLKGKGYGHHLGLCQWGTREMVKKGWRYRDILNYYYPGTTFMKLT